MRNLTPEPSPWEVLAERGAHFVLCKPTKVALSNGWQKHQGPDLEAVIAHARHVRGLVGVIPSSVGCVVSTMTKAVPHALRGGRKNPRPTCRVDDRTKRDWRSPSLVSVYRRREQSQVAVSPPAVAMYAADEDTPCYGIRRRSRRAWRPTTTAAEPVDVSLLPKPKRGGATGPEAVAKALPGDAE